MDDLGNRRSDIYINGVREFLDFAFSNIPTSTDGEEYKVPCPYKQYNNSRHKTREEINEDLFINGIVCGCTRWIYHGEYAPSLKRPRKDSEEDNHLDSIFEMIHDACDEDEVHAYSRDDMNDLVVEANNLNQPREFDGHGSENDSDHDDNESDVDATNNDAHSISEDDIA
ncbi:hypothetical protein Cgig2_015236 [Carnegiea gigantea]|uniref:Transposase-associated domain-containing protein n=1 Tax=Carnegiea gigantea TaxID=171969 RepID=A0A9Q1KJU4_9CARY|nr:hypothetical protein Cgig2_015236 [Carnegiea gigantea]